jgi:hypothetical protein
MSEVRWILPASTLGAPSDWYKSISGYGPRVRFLDDGRIEIEGKGVVKEDIPTAVNQWASVIWDAANKYGLPAHFLAGIMSLESGGNKNAGSYAGAYGLMQLTLDTAKQFKGRKVTKEELLSDPVLNVDLGT